MAYPGEGHTMSNYSKKDPSPQEVVGHWKECCRGEQRIHKNHIAIKGDGSASFPGVKCPDIDQLQSPQSFFHDASIKREYDTSYDRLFHADTDYNSKLHRDDRQHTVGLDIHAEESRRSVPVRSSTEYGRRVEEHPLEGPSRKYSKVERVMKGFYRTRGTGIPSSMD